MFSIFFKNLSSLSSHIWEAKHHDVICYLDYGLQTVILKIFWKREFEKIFIQHKSVYVRLKLFLEHFSRS